ncbi:hypothetical protein IAI10_13110 [Clostridium sp. 19966]|uniref:hypothetical protein n=1 Tax=Clostridium sp. 19966 TaxID=2768166 RepID=UPI0028DEF045|nr:hypothetical protein [Clostridium sp. 19966]MDT8717605.1 hypothetical protein [Clostridium sp. 19966]
MDNIELIDTALSNALDSIPVRYGWYDENINETHVTFILLNEDVEGYSDDEDEITGTEFQVDIWSRDNVEDLKKQIKKALKAIDCTFLQGQDQYEEDTKIYHKALRFFILNEESE